MSRITPMRPTVFVPSGTAHRIVIELLARAEEGKAPAPAADRVGDASRTDLRNPLPSAA